MTRLPSTTLFTVFTHILVLCCLAACGQSKKSGGNATLAATTTEDANNADQFAVGGKAGADQTACVEEEQEDEDQDAVKEEDDEHDEEAMSLAGKGHDKQAKGKDKPKCSTTSTPPSTPPTTPAPTTPPTTPPAPTPSPAPTTPVASLAEGQKIYLANCQGCHGALPGEKQGRTAAQILSASSVGAHRNITPWPAANSSTFSAQLAAESLAMALK